jgi:hypothetical protein
MIFVQSDIFQKYQYKHINSGSNTGARGNRMRYTKWEEGGVDFGVYT